MKHELNTNKQFGPKQKESTKDQDPGCFIFFSFKQKAIIQISALMSRKEILFKMITCPCAKLGVNHIPKQTQHMPFFHHSPSICLSVNILFSNYFTGTGHTSFLLCNNVQDIQRC